MKQCLLHDEGVQLVQKGFGLPWITVEVQEVL
jgi:hypothetical protein